MNIEHENAKRGVRDESSCSSDQIVILDIKESIDAKPFSIPPHHQPMEQKESQLVRSERWTIMPSVHAEVCLVPEPHDWVQKVPF